MRSPKPFYAEIVTDKTVGDTMQLLSDGECLSITNESPWSGDTETGFGRDVTLTLSRSHVVELIGYLQRWLKEAT